MGSDAHYLDERPAREVEVAGFWIDRHPVTNADFAAFVAATGYVTTAEITPSADDYPGAPPENLQPGSMVFTMTRGLVDLRNVSNWWRWVPGASWRRPQGPGSNLDEMDLHPVVHVTHDDAAAYASWVGRQLPTEAEWEFAARGGLDGAEFTWGGHDPQDGAQPDVQLMANTWQGHFPYLRSGPWRTTSPVGAFPPNGFGLADMAGNVWEWTTDWYSPTPAAARNVAPCCAPPTPPTKEGSYDAAQPQFAIPRRVIKGGSHLCSRDYCFRYRPAARQPQMVDTSTSHLGFRCVRRTPTRERP